MLLNGRRGKNQRTISRDGEQEEEHPDNLHNSAITGRPAGRREKPCDLHCPVKSTKTENAQCVYSSEFHIGKEGGGSVRKRPRSFWKIWVDHVCHSISRPNDLDGGSGEGNIILVNIRDPMDRFESAFCWRLTILCGPNDPRNRRLASFQKDLHTSDPVEQNGLGLTPKKVDLNVVRKQHDLITYTALQQFSVKTDAWKRFTS